MTASCIYTGTIRHRRAQPHNEFEHPIALTYIDLEELPSLLGGRLLARGPGSLRFRRRDYLGGRAGADSLDVAVRDAVQQQTAWRPDGPIRLLTQLRSFGLCFNPVSFYYCLDHAGQRVRCVLAEVTNTPWGERQSYVLDETDAGVIRGSFPKRLHVSPFMGMDHDYRARAGTPADTLSVHIESRRAGQTAFDATLSLRRRELTRAAVARLSARFPFATLRTLALIYGHAVGLKLAGARIHPHPDAATR
ncbi:MAG: DUF1365 domain-containing protein [Solirubrobacteraceae bacterium]